MRPAIDLTGRRFGRLTVIERAGHTSKHATWRCLCDCGADLVVRGDVLRREETVSCGCWRRDRLTTHGESYSPEFATWKLMIGRCTNPNDSGWAKYGGRGIAVCERWLSFENFLADMGRKPSAKYSIERVDNSEGYSPDNCKWATPTDQARNTRRTRLTIELAREIRERSSQGESDSSIERSLGLGEGHVHHVRLGHIWKEGA